MRARFARTRSGIQIRRGLGRARPVPGGGRGPRGYAPVRVPSYQSYPDGMSITAPPSLLPFLLFPLGLGVNNLPDYRPLGLGVNNLPDYGEQSQLGANRHSGGGVLLVRHEYARRQNAGLPHSIRAARTAAGIPAYGHGMQSTMRWGVGAIRVPAPQERDRRRPSWDLAGTHGSKDVVQRFSTPTRQRPVLRLCGGIRRMRPASGGPAAAGAGHALFGVARASPDGADLEGFVPRAGPGARWKLARFC